MGFRSGSMVFVLAGSINIDPNVEVAWVVGFWVFEFLDKKSKTQWVEMPALLLMMVSPTTTDTIQHATTCQQRGPDSREDDGNCLFISRFYKYTGTLMNDFPWFFGFIVNL